ncbi:MAG: phosphatase PAP2 family protein [Ruminococcus sp.]|nr:phosphatase PAP2 family protein [Ruminococcus sp.]
MSIFDALKPFDTFILDFIQNSIKCSFMDYFMSILSFISYDGLIWVVLAVFLLFFKKSRKTGLMIIVALVLGFVICELGLKHIVMRPRPFTLNPDIILIIKQPSGSSFPSWHSCSSFVAATILLKYDKKIGIPATIIALLIVFSRLYCYVHYPTDVTAGIIIGILCAIIVMVAFKKIQQNKKSQLST